MLDDLERVGEAVRKGFDNMHKDRVAENLFSDDRSVLNGALREEEKSNGTMIFLTRLICLFMIIFSACRHRYLWSVATYSAMAFSLAL